MTEPLVLAGDVGGTKSCFGLFAPGRGRPRQVFSETFSSPSAKSLETLLEQFLGAVDRTPAAVCIGIAGAVENGRVQATNLPWRVSAARLGRRFGWERVRLVNDIVALAAGLRLTGRGETARLQRGRRLIAGNVAVAAPGTGLGMALVVRDGDGREVIVASEGGHVGFAPRGRDEADLWEWLHDRFDHVSAERVASGPGLYHIYQWLRERGRFSEPVWLAQAVGAGDPPKVIAETAARYGDPLCRAAVERFVAILGAVAGDLALTGMARGGLWLGGGIPPRILPFLQTPGFLDAFTGKGRLAGLLRRIPVNVSLSPRTALRGAALLALQELGDDGAIPGSTPIVCR
ncbi:MAG: glucokinase [Deltaproteobacteria bacterium]|nr:glucokinase [Candidatus Anaeroferrophillacea bacterium]